MMTKRGAWITLTGAMVLLLALAACEPEPIFMSCPLSTSIIKVCEDQADGNDTFTCVVEDHPFCLERTCASWQGQPSVCTRVCTTDAECTTEADAVGASTCTYDEVLDLRFCVPNTHITAHQDGVIVGQ